MSRCLVYPSLRAKDSRPKPVKNLGWLLRHAGDVREIEFQIGRDGSVMQIAYLRDDRRFVCNWADVTVCERWFKRPSFRGLPLFIVDYRKQRDRITKTTC